MINCARAAVHFSRRLRLPLGRATLTSVLWFVAFEGAYYIAYRYSMQFSQSLPAPFWFPDSVLLCAFLKARPRYWWIFILGALPVRLFSDVGHNIPFWFLLGAASVNYTQTLVAAALLRRFMNNPMHFSTIRDLIVFVGIAVVGAPTLAAFAGAALRSVRGYDYWQSWENWLLGSALAQLVVAPAFFYLVFDASRLREYFNVKRVTEAGVIAVGIAAAGYFATHTVSNSIALNEAALYAPIPFLFWAAIRFGMAGACGAAVMMAFFSVEAALNGHGPYRGLAPAETNFALQSFLLLRSAPLYLIAVAVEQEKTVERTLRESEEQARRRAEDDLRALAHAQRLAVMGELTATIAHELRQPLTALLLDAEVTQKLSVAHPDNLMLQDVLQDMRVNAARADGVISRVRTFVGKEAQRLQSCVVNDIVADVLVLIGRDAQRRGVAIQTDLERDLPSITANPVQIQQVLINLIVNGMDAMESVTTHTHLLKLSTRKTARGEVEFGVWDAGTGISPEHMKLLFNSFWSTKPNGMGLGLTIARTIVREHHGRIWAENNPGGGATFYFALPRVSEA